MNKNILLITTMYPNPLRPGTPVCHYFAKEWQKMGYNVLVLHYRSMFPPYYTWAARLFPKLAQRYVGNHVEMDRNMDTQRFEYDGIPVYSIPIFKYIPHHKYPNRIIRKEISNIQNLLQNEKFIPDAIIGHFCNPQIILVSKLKTIFPKAKTCVSFHESDMSCIRNLYPKDYRKIIDSIDYMGFRSEPIKRSFELNYGTGHNSLLCYSGTSKFFLTHPRSAERNFTNDKLTKFIYVGQFIRRKYPKVVVQALNETYPDKNFKLTYVGKKEICYAEIQNYIEQRGLSDKVLFTDKIPREEIVRHYDEAECFIMVSRGEVFGLVYLEAMSRGCITIASRNEGMEGIIEDSVNGFLCEAGNKDELCQIIDNINHLSAQEKKRISDNGRKTAEMLSDFNVAKHYIETITGRKD